MFYAGENRISTEPFEDSIEISEEQYQEALSGLLEGKRIAISNGFEVITPDDPEEIEDPQTPPTVMPFLFATAGIVIVSGIVTLVELAPQIASAYYEDGWMTLAFIRPQEDDKYLIFVQTDVPAKVEQFKDLGSFELIFSDPVTGDPIEPGRIDLQILKVR